MTGGYFKRYPNGVKIIRKITVQKLALLKHSNIRLVSRWPRNHHQTVFLAPEILHHSVSTKPQIRNRPRRRCGKLLQFRDFGSCLSLCTTRHSFFFSSNTFTRVCLSEKPDLNREQTPLTLAMVGPRPGCLLSVRWLPGPNLIIWRPFILLAFATQRAGLTYYWAAASGHLSWAVIERGVLHWIAATASQYAMTKWPLTEADLAVAQSWLSWWIEVRLV